MIFLLTSQQCFVIAFFAFGLIGFIRGWRREVISLAFALTGVLFLLLNGGNALAQLVFVKTPIIIHDVFSTGGPAPSTAAPSPTAVLTVTLIAFVTIVVLGYNIGNRAFSGKNLSPADRLLGILPGLVTGYFLITYIARTFAQNPVISVGVGTPTENLLTTYVPLLFVVSIVAVLAGLIAASRAKKSAAKK
jgi:hypothetical protein